MDRAQARKFIVDMGIVPVVRAGHWKKAVAAAEAAFAGGISVVEITMTVPDAARAISTLKQSFGDQLLVGAGTVLDVAGLKTCLDAGAEFIAAPGFDAEVVAACNAADKPIIAGALTPTEIIYAWRCGADLVKVFPCSALGGAGYIKALRGPLPHIPLVPTGGVNLETAVGLLKAGATALGVGGELVSAKALNSGNLDWITETARKFVTLVRETRATEPAGVLIGD